MTYSKDQIVTFIIIVLHSVGCIGSIVASTQGLVIALTPVNLLITGGLLLYSHQGSTDRLMLFFLLSTIVGFVVESIGVATGFPFGVYSYGKTLGIKWLDVPIIIGVNWFILSYCFGIITSNLPIHWIIRCVVASLGMVALDFLIEPIAVKFDYWTWSGSHIPASNYIGWFLTSFVIQIAFDRVTKKTQSQQAFVVIGCQACYFLMLLIFLKF